ncbi:site-specific integrase [Paraburkholderia nemoris]|uniref:site-specific integrase n=1 Tax=Paraburkholderia nemoris TaxID=2793076 RepID=UPI0038B6D8FE
MDELMSVKLLSSKRWVVRPHPLYGKREHVVNWGRFLAKELGGSKHQRSYLIRSCQQLMLAIISRLETRHGCLSPGTVRMWFGQIRVFAVWLARREIWRFSLTSPDDLQEYLKIRFSNQDGTSQPTAQTVQQHLYLLSLMWELRDEYIAPLKFDPSTYLQCAFGPRRPQRKQGWLPLEEKVAVSMLSEAVAWIETIGSAVTTLCSRVSGNSPKICATPGVRRGHWRRLFSQLAASSEGQLIVATLPMNGVPFKRILAAAVRQTIGATLIICLLLTGMRISEVLSLQENCVRKKMLPSGRTYTFVAGTAAKRQGHQRLWVAPQVVIEALKLASSLNGKPRGASGENYIYLMRQRMWFVPQPGRSAQMLSRLTAIEYVREFITSVARKVRSEDASWFHPHRMRKTFARFVILRNKASLEALAYHYGHLYTAVLDGVYVGSDMGLAEMLSDETAVELERCLTELLSASNVAGRAGERLMAMHRTSNSSRSFKGQAALKSIAQRLIREGVTLAPCDWGYCVYVSDLSACKGDHSGPNPVRRNPTTCGTCSNFSATEIHRPWWEQKYRQEEEFLRRDDLPEQTRTIVEARFRVTARILRDISQHRPDERGAIGASED